MGNFAEVVCDTWNANLRAGGPMTNPSEHSAEKDVPLSDAPADLRELLVSLAESNVDHPARPCCDAETTLRDWEEAGFDVKRSRPVEDTSAASASALRTDPDSSDAPERQ